MAIKVQLPRHFALAEEPCARKIKAEPRLDTVLKQVDQPEPVLELIELMISCPLQLKGPAFRSCP